jgi:hypothetical protein
VRILILSSLQIPPLVLVPCAELKVVIKGFENGSLGLSNRQFIPKFPENKSKKERVDDYWVAQGKKCGATLPLQAQNMINASKDRVDNIYDSRGDELL